MNSNFKTRLNAAFQAKGLKSQADLARAIKAKPQVVNKWFHGRTAKISAVDLFKLTEALDVSARWLLFGKGQVARYTELTPDEWVVISIYRNLPEEWREDWLTQGNRTLNRLTDSPSRTVPFKQNTPVKN